MTAAVGAPGAAALAVMGKFRGPPLLPVSLIPNAGTAKAVHVTVAPRALVNASCVKATFSAWGQYHLHFLQR